MPAYMLANVEIVNSERYPEYREATMASIKTFGGRFVIRGGEATVKEGSFVPKRLVMIEFRDRATAEAWYDSPEYAAAKAMRQAWAISDVVIIDGYNAPAA